MPQLQLFISPYNHYEKTVVLRIDSDKTLGDLRNAITDRRGFGNYKLVHQCKFIDGLYNCDDTLEHIGITDEATIYLKPIIVVEK